MRSTRWRSRRSPLGALLAAAAASCAAAPSPQPPAAPSAGEAPAPAPEGAPESAAAAVTPTGAASSAPASASLAADAREETATAAPRPAPPPIPPSTAVLHVGDSMVHSGLAQALRPRFKQFQVRYEVRGEESTFTTTWAGRMDGLVAATQPDLVLITLGGNEIGNVQPSSHARFVRRIVNAAKGRPCVWMTAPLWRHETGIYDVIQEHSAPCRFFETDRFLREPLERRGDKIHPTAKGGEDWAAVFWEWLMEERVGGEKPWALREAPADEHTPRGLRNAPVFPRPGEAPSASPSALRPAAGSIDRGLLPLGG